MGCEWDFTLTLTTRLYGYQFCNYSGKYFIHTYAIYLAWRERLTNRGSGGMLKQSLRSSENIRGFGNCIRCSKINTSRFEFSYLIYFLLKKLQRNSMSGVRRQYLKERKIGKEKAKKSANKTTAMRSYTRGIKKNVQFVFCKYFIFVRNI